MKEKNHGLCIFEEVNHTSHTPHMVHNFTNHAQHFVKLIDHILILALITHHVNLLPSSYNSYVFQ